MELKCDAIIKGTKVDGIYDKDPVKHPDAVRFSRISYDETLQRRLEVMDATAITLARENNMPIIVCNMFGRRYPPCGMRRGRGHGGGGSVASGNSRRGRRLQLPSRAPWRGNR